VHGNPRGTLLPHHVAHDLASYLPITWPISWLVIGNAAHLLEPPASGSVSLS
jgi:hypothetical protein